MGTPVIERQLTGDSESFVLTASTELTDAKLKSLSSTVGIEVIPAPDDVSKILIPIAGMAKYSHNTTNYNVAVTLELYYSSSDVINTSTSLKAGESVSMETQEVDNRWGMFQIGDSTDSSAISNPEGLGIYVCNTGTQLTTGDGIMEVKILYMIKAVS